MHTLRTKETLTMLIKKEIRKINGNAFFIKEKEHNYLEIATKLLTLTSSFAVIFGGIVILFYLNHIKHPNIFATIIGSPYNLVAILIVFIILLLSIFAGFMTPYTILLGRTDIPLRIWNSLLENGVLSKVFFTLFLPHALYIYLLIAFLIPPETFIKNCHIKYFLWVITISPLLPLIFYFVKDKHDPISKRINSYLFVFFILFSASSLGFLFPTYIALRIAQWAPKELNQLLPLIGYELVILLNLLFASYYLSSKNNQKNKRFIVLMPVTLSYLFLTISSIFIENVPFRLLHPIRFVESSNEASWYLLRQDNSGINSADLKIIKSAFVCQPSEQQNAGKNPTHICTEEANHRHNALFGYMAWNLGNVKVFCPITVKNDVKKNETENAINKCLTIDSKALQKMYVGHIGYSRTP